MLFNFLFYVSITGIRLALVLFYMLFNFLFYVCITGICLALVSIDNLVIGRVIVFNTTFSNISVIFVTVSFIGGGNRRKPLTCDKSLTNKLLY